MESIFKKLGSFTLQKDMNEIYTTLNALPAFENEQIFMDYIEELYRGNGWLTKKIEVAGDYEILLYYPSSDTEASFIIRAKNQKQPLTFEEAKKELLNFENGSAKTYRCKNYILISLNGFDDKAKELSGFNMKLEDREYITSLVVRYEKDSVQTPNIELFAHNKEAYLSIKKMWEEDKRVAAVQATGTGKSYLILQCLIDFPNEHKLVLAPSHHILNSLKDKAASFDRNTTFMTYSQAMNLTKEEIGALHVSFIVLDEFHRIGANKWGSGVERILAAHPYAYVLGTSATPIRYLDNQRDMSEELFHKNEAINLSLSDAIAKEILPIPKYVSALYTLEEEIDKITSRIKNSENSQSEKSESINNLKKYKSKWELAGGVSAALEKHIAVADHKFIVFCKNKEHLMEMESQVAGWFEQAYKKKGITRKIRRYRVIHDESGCQKVLASFESTKNKNELHLLFCIEMLNEGLHIKDVDGVILLRPTTSPIIFYQQIGRAIAAGNAKEPLIFDFINNFLNLKSVDFLTDLEKSNRQENKKRKKLGLTSVLHDYKINITDETHDFSILIGKIENSLYDFWNTRYQELIVFYEQHGHCNVPKRYAENPKLATWVNTQRKSRERISEDKRKKLDDLSFDWNPFATFWNERYEELVEYQKVFGHCSVPFSYTENPKLMHWVRNQRVLKDTMSEEKKSKLNELGFDWNPISTYWNSMYETLSKFKSENGHCHVHSSDPKYQKLINWIYNQRKNKNTMSEEKKKKLNDIGFDWSLNRDWNSMYEELVRFRSEEGHCNVPRTTDQKNKKLAYWVSSQRSSKSTMSEEKKQMLDELGFVWEKQQSDWSAHYKKLVLFHSENGHCNVPRTTIENITLANWIKHQRATKNKMNQEKREKLNNIGFDWNPKETEWNTMYETLIAFQTKNGHCNIDQSHMEDSPLGTWVKSQRKSNLKGTLSEVRTKKLNEIGFFEN